MNLRLKRNPSSSRPRGPLARASGRCRGWRWHSSPGTPGLLLRSPSRPGAEMAPPCAPGDGAEGARQYSAVSDSFTAQSACASLSHPRDVAVLHPRSAAVGHGGLCHLQGAGSGGVITDPDPPCTTAGNVSVAVRLPTAAGLVLNSCRCQRRTCRPGSTGNAW